jgi:arylsulfatase
MQEISMTSTRRQFVKQAGALAAAPFALQGRRKPNVLIILTDQQRAGTLSADGHPYIETPNMDRIAARGTSFSNHFCATPQCSPSRAALLTGRYPHRAGVEGNMKTNRSDPIRAEIPSVGSVFRDAGYRTAYLGKWHLTTSPGDCGWDIHGTEVKERQGVSPKGKLDQDEDSTINAEKFLQETREPWCMCVSYRNPHDIYHYWKDRASLGNVDDIPLPLNFYDDLTKKPKIHRQFMTDDQGDFIVSQDEAAWQGYRAYYKKVTEIVDAQIGRVLDALESRDDADETLVLFTSDHGDMDAGHRLCFKGPFMYDELCNVPLIFSLPGVIPAGESREQLVSNIDLLPTLCEYAGLQAPEGIDGRSFTTEVASPGAPGRPYVIGEYHGKQKWDNPIRMIRTKDWKYNRYIYWGEELYDLRNDPGEMINRANAIQYKVPKAELTEALDDWMQSTGDTFAEYGITDRAGNVL